jgi:hypothetical protein
MIRNTSSGTSILWGGGMKVVADRAISFSSSGFRSSMMSDSRLNVSSSDESLVNPTPTLLKCAVIRSEEDQSMG